MKRIYSGFGCALICLAANLCPQTANAADAAGAAGESDVPDFRPFSFGLEASTTGLGGSANWRFTDHFGARVGFNYFSYSKDNNDIEGISYNTDTRLMSEPLALDIYPWAHRSFRITVGVLFNQNQLEGVAPRDPVYGNTFIDINGTSYDSASIGDVNLKIEQTPVAPYISIGASYYFDKAKHWSLSGELGVAYTGTPDVTLTTSSGLVPQQDLNGEAQQIEDAAWKVYPIVKLGVNYSF